MMCRPARMWGRRADIGLNPSVVVVSSLGGNEGMAGSVVGIAVIGAVLGAVLGAVIELEFVAQLQVGSHML